MHERKESPMPAMDDRDFEEIRAHARLPQMDIDILHRRAREGDGAFLSVSVEILPFSERLGRLAAMSDPFRFWGQVAALAWWPWLQALRLASSEPGNVRRLPKAEEK